MFDLSASLRSGLDEVSRLNRIASVGDSVLFTVDGGATASVGVVAAIDNRFGFVVDGSDGRTYQIRPEQIV